MSKLYSLQIEKHSLAGLIRNPEVFADVDRFISDKDYYVDVHQTIFNCIKNIILSGEKIDKVLLAQKIKNLGISFKSDLNIFEYIDSVSFIPVSPEGTISAFRELAKLRVLRSLSENSEKIKSHLEKNINEPLEKTVAEIDAIYGKPIELLTNIEEECDLFAGLLDLAEERGNNPQTEIGFATPFPEYNRLYGGYRKGNLHIIASRAKSGKSTFLNHVASEMSKMHKMPVLYLDTEMSTEETQFRAIAAKTGVPLWYVETGNWRKNPEYVKKIRGVLKDVNGFKVHHRYVGNKSLDEIKSICRRWRLKYAGRDGNCMIVFDYIKAVEKLTGSQQEYQLMGDKVDALKQLAQELNCPIITAVQNNRSGITTGRTASEIQDDEASVGISDRITWYATTVHILRRRVEEEIVLDTRESGTHKLIELVARFQGRDAAGHQDLVRRRFPDGKIKFIKNFINIDIQNFNVEERGSLRNSIARQNAQFQVTDEDAEERASETL
jgi:replicative DNA helicase